ncbi:MAG: virulence RhuM family protein, partial [Candidatus Marinimicrobia bacterium]|nr:virulence RhuM family protein [Candidatus Neomarinimicrobiota bacterium]
MNKENSIIIYKQKDNTPAIDVWLDKDTIWLDAHQISSLLGVNRPAIVKHIGNIYKSKELNKKSTCSILEQVAADGKVRKMNFYNLDMIISVGYRVKSNTATQFRIWATNTLRDHLVKGYTINEKRLQAQAHKYQELKNSV